MCNNPIHIFERVRASLPRDQIDSVRVSFPGLLFSDFFAIVKRCLASLPPLTLVADWYRSNKLKIDIIEDIDGAIET